MTRLIGILNVTPDSFSDGGEFLDSNSAIEHIIKLLDDNAYAVDIGAESTRPTATPLSAIEEWIRLEPVIRKIIDLNLESKISIDTRNISTAEQSLELGIKWINDVSGLANKDSIQLIKKHNAKITIMHNLGLPADKNKTLPVNINPINTIYKWGESAINTLLTNGLKKNQIIFDPGIGFGKTPEQSLQIIHNAHIFKKLDVPIMIGHSRKSFMNLTTDQNFDKRDQQTATISKKLATKEIDYLRVHNVLENNNAIKDY